MFGKLYKQLYQKIRLLQYSGKEPYFSLYKIIGFFPKNIKIYELALLHKSSSVETDDGKWINNERLEFLGDGILDAVVADIVYKRYPNKREGFMTNARSRIVQRETMNKLAVELGLDKLIVYSTRVNSHHSHVYGNALEALIGAIYLDQGYDVCYKFIRDVLIGQHLNVDKLVYKEVNFKSSLIEWSQKNKISISFELLESFVDNEGNPVFQTAVILLEENIGVGIGYSKKESQQIASKMAVKRLRTDKALQLRISESKKKLGEKSEVFSELPEEEEEG